MEKKRLMCFQSEACFFVLLFGVVSGLHIDNIVKHVQYLFQPLIGLFNWHWTGCNSKIGTIFHIFKVACLYVLPFVFVLFTYFMFTPQTGCRASLLYGVLN